MLLGSMANAPSRERPPSRRQALLEELGEPLLSSTLRLPGDDLPLTDPLEMRERLEHLVDLVIDGGSSGFEPTTVVSFESGSAELVRAGRGDVTAFVD